MSSSISRRAALAAAFAFTLQPNALAQTPPTSNVPAVIQDLRRGLLQPPYNALLFRSVDRIYDARRVNRGGPVWRLPRREQSLDFTYQFEGKTFTPDQFMDRTYTNAMLVMKDGVIVYETYRNLSSDQDRFIGFSMTKSITSILIGAAVAEGRIKSLDDPIERYLPELKDGGYRGVTIRQILQMRSGVDYKENYDPRDKSLWAPGTPRSGNVDHLSRVADGARTAGRARPPGSAFHYLNLDTAVLGWLIERVSGGSSVAAYASQRLWEPLGAEADGYFLTDGPPGVGREYNVAGYNATLRDWGRVGLMMMNGGVANGRRILSEAWVAESTKTLLTDDSGREGYGYQWWTVPGTDAYAARGLAGQTVFIQPSTRTVIVKLSYYPPSTDGRGPDLEAESAAFMAAASAWRPR